MGVQIANILIIKPNLVIEPLWTATITLECGGPAALDNAFLALALVQTGEIAMGFGAYYGCVLESYLFDGCQTAFKDEETPCCPCFNRTLRALVFLVLAVAGLSIGAFDLIDFIKTNSVTHLLFGQLLPIFFGPFLPFAFGDKVCGKLALLEVPERTRSERESQIKLNPSNQDDREFF